MSRKSKKRIRNTSKPRRNVNNTTNDNFSDKLLISFHYPNWMNSTKEKSFCNLYKDEESMILTFKHVLYDIFPYIEKNSKEVITGHNHCHVVKEEPIKNKVLKVIKDINNVNIEEDANIYQMANGIGSVRVFGVLIKDRCSIFYPLFIDVYHKIYPSCKYNSNDIKKYRVKLQNFDKDS